MKNKLKSLLALALSVLIGHAWAADPVATWTDFNTLTSGNYTITKDEACTVNADGSVTLGGAGLSYAFKSGDGMYANKVITVVMDVTLPDTAGTLLTLGLATNKIQVNSTGSALTTSYDKGAVRQTGACTAERTTIAVTYSGSQGVHVYKDGDLIITDGALRWSGQNLAKLTIGACDDGTIPLTEMTIHKLRVYSEKLSAIDVALDAGVFQEVIVDEDKDYSALNLQNAGNVKIIINEGCTLTMNGEVTCNSLVIQGPGVVALDSEVGDPFEGVGGLVFDGVTLQGGATDYIDVSSLISIISGKTLKTRGFLNFTNQSNAIDSGATLEVVSGVTKFYAAEQGIKGVLTIDSDATFVNTRPGDALAYNTSGVEVNVYGTLDMGSTRWTIFANNNTINAYAGATITGVGQSGNGALDVWEKADENNDNVAFNIYKNGENASDVTVFATIRYRERETVFNIAEGMTANLAGTNANINTIYGGLKVKGSGVLKLSDKNAYADIYGAGIKIDSGATLMVNHVEALGSQNIVNNGTLELDVDDASVTFAKVISGSGAVNVKSGAWKLTKTNYVGNNVLIESGAILDVSSDEARLFTTNNYLSTAVLTVNGTLITREWNYGESLGNLRHNDGAVVINGGKVIFAQNSSSERYPRIGAEGATFEIAEGVVYTAQRGITGSGNLNVASGILKLQGTSTISGSMTIAEEAKVIVDSGESSAFAENLEESAGVNVNGTIEFLSSGMLYRSFAGNGVVAVKGDVAINNTGNNGKLTGLSRFKGSVIVDEGKTLTLTFWNNGYDIELSELEVNGSVTGNKGNGYATTLNLITTKLSGSGTISGVDTFTLADGATLAGAVTVTGDVTVEGAVNVTHAAEAGDTVITCANAEAVAAALTGAPAGLKYVAENGAVKLAAATVTVTLPAAPENMFWFYDGQPVENNAVTVNSGTSVTVTLKPAIDYIFSDNTTEKTFNLGEVTGDITGEIDIEDIVAVKPEVKIGEKSYATFASALAAAEDGDTIVLEKDVICTEKPVFNNGGVVNVDVRDYVFVSTEQARVRNVASADGKVPSNNIKFVSGFGWEVYQYNNMPATNVEFRVFPTLEAAVTYNPSTNNPARIYPYQNVTQEADVTLKAYPAGTSSTICIDPEYDITWDLNGYTVLQESPTGNPLEACVRGKFTLKDSSAEQSGKWIAGACGVTNPESGWYGNGGPALYVLGEGELVLEGGTISIARNATLDTAGKEIVNSGGLIRVDGGKLNVNGATLQVDDTYGIMAWGGEIEINAGTFDIDPEVSVPVYASGWYEDVAVEVNSFFAGALCVYGNNVAGYKGASATVNVAGIEYATGSVWFVPSVGEGLMVFDGLVLEKGVAVVKSATSVNTYATLADAVAAAQAGDTITLMADTTENITVPTGFTGTIDLGGNTLTGNVKAAYSEATTTDFILQNGYIITPAGNTDKGAIFIKYAAVELIDIDLTAYYHGIRTEVGGNVTINGGRYEAICKPSTQYNVVYAKEDSTITIEDGTFIRTPNGGTVYCINPNATDSEIYVNGGSFTTIGSVYLVDMSAKGTCAISGGLFSVAAKNDVNKKLASGYGIEDVVDTDYFTVVEKPAIEPDGSIEVEAADAAAAANKVEILIPEGVAGVDAATYATYFTKTATYNESTGKYTVTAALNPEVVTPKITAISFDENGVTITLENKLPGLYYAVRSAATVDKVDTDEATVTTELNAPATGDAAFYRVLVDFAPIAASQPKPAE